MPKLLGFGPKVLNIMLIWNNFKWNSSGDRKPIAFKAYDLFRIIREQPDLFNPQIRKDLRPYAILAEIRLESKRFIRLYRVHALIL